MWGRILPYSPGWSHEAGILNSVETVRAHRRPSLIEVMPKVFISYRRVDSEDVAARIYDRLRKHYDVVFDVDDVPIGVDFRKYLHDQVVECDALLAIIGQNWLTVSEEDGRRRLDNPRDHLRIEIESAVRESKPVIPVLVRRARMPREDELPETLAFLAYINAATVSSGKDFEGHAQRLIRGVNKLLDRPAPTETLPVPSPPTKTSPRKPPTPRSDEADRAATAEPEIPDTGPWLLDQLKIAAMDLLPNTTWKSKGGWWSLGSRRGFHLMRATATRNTLRVRIRKNAARRTRAKANAKGWIYESKGSIVRDHRQLDRALEVFRREWL